MPESTHDLVAAKAARLRELMPLADVQSQDITAQRLADDTVIDGLRSAPTWSGGGWNN
jgi:hypothetical protein